MSILINNSKSKRGYLFAVIGIGLTTALLASFQTNINSTTVALALLLIVLAIATVFGSRPALLTALLGVLSLNFFFLPPLYTFTISDSQNWVAFAAFLLTAIIAGQLSSYARRRAVESEIGRREIERLYSELQNAFEQASQAEALRQSEKLKSALLDAVTHDIRTPLTSIKASVTILLDEAEEKHFEGETPIKLNAEMRGEMLKIINEETDRLNHFVEGMVELAQIEAGKTDYRRKWDAIEDIVEAALLRAEPRVRGRKINVEFERNLPTLRVDSRAVAEVIYTLVDNAAKYSPPDAAIYISAGRSGESDVILSVADEGKGIPTEMRERVFDKFFRAARDGDTGISPSGNGLGLAIAKGIVEAHNGKIRVGEASNGGAVFEFTLPIDNVDEAENQVGLIEEKEILPQIDADERG